jgi:hypothetical protein
MCTGGDGPTRPCDTVPGCCRERSSRRRVRAAYVESTLVVVGIEVERFQSHGGVVDGDEALLDTFFETMKSDGGG